MTQLLSDLYYLPRAGRYANPLNSNDHLPLVYGDLTDGTLGIWVAPCIDTVNYVYAFSGAEVLSVANGNSISVYENNLLLDPAMYTFDEANDYEGKGVIATIDFATPKTGATITVRGKGKPTASGGATLMEDIVAIAYDFLTVENTFTSAQFEATKKSYASQIFSVQAYKAAGVIDQDAVIWDIITEMMASFLGSAYRNGAGLLCLEIDDGTISQYGQAGIIRGSDAVLVEARQRFINLINQVPAHYCYNYAAGEFRSRTNEAAHADTISQAVYGVREPVTPYQSYWCRDTASVQAVQDIIVSKFKNPVYEIEIDDLTAKRIHVDVGDCFIFSADRLYDKNGDRLMNHYWKVLSARPDFQRGRVAFRALQTNYYMTTAFLADGTYLADGSVLAGNNRDTAEY
jgi:hypothetical protein